MKSNLTEADSPPRARDPTQGEHAHHAAAQSVACRWAFLCNSYALKFNGVIVKISYAVQCRCRRPGQHRVECIVGRS